MKPMTEEERDRLIEAAEELKKQRTKETCKRGIVMLKGNEWAPGRWTRDRYFIVNIPKVDLGRDVWGDADRYVNNSRRFPLFSEMTNSGKYERSHVCHFVGEEEIEEIGGA